MVETTQNSAGLGPALTGAPAPVAAYGPANGAPLTPIYGTDGPAPAAPAAAAEPAAADPYAGLVEQWKRQHRNVTEITINAPGETVRCFIHNPDRNVIAYALTKVMNKQLLEAGEWILNNCFLGGDPRCNPGSEQADDRLVIAAAMEAAGTIELLSANSKKL